MRIAVVETELAARLSSAGRDRVGLESSWTKVAERLEEGLVPAVARA